MKKITLKEKDADFIINTIAPGKKNLKELLIKEEEFRQSLITDDRVFNRAMNQKGILEQISPALFFEILLRRAFKEMGKTTYTIERTVAHKIPVFDSFDALELTKNQDFLYYLIDLLSSFVSREENTSKDTDLDSLIKMGANTQNPENFLIHKRIGDICLFILGVFPEYLSQDYYYLFFNKKPPTLGKERRSVADYEFLGQEFYHLAAKESRGNFLHFKEILHLLSENFYLAKKPLNFISEKYFR
jgi:hypothetical protein